MLRALLRVNLTAVPLLCLAFPVHSQVLNLPPDVEVAYPAAPLPHEMLVRTANGCGFFLLKPDDTTIRVSPSVVQYVTDTWKRHSWSGLCPGGLALGPGEMKAVGSNGQLLSTSTWYALRGRSVGEATTLVAKSDAYAPLTVWSYTWKGVTYTRNVPLVVTPLQAPGPGRMTYAVGVQSPDHRQTVSWSMYGADGRPARLVRSAVTDKYMETGKFSDRLTEFVCPGGNCGSVWMQHAAPVLQMYMEFQARSEPEVAALQSSLKPVLEPLLKQHQQVLIAAEKQRVSALQAERLAAQQRALNDANRERRPIPTPGLDALVKKALGGAG